MKYRISFLFVIFILEFAFFPPWGGQRGAAQDIHFSQFYNSAHILNPALTGANGYMEGVLNYKTQWRSVAVPYNTFAASYAMRMRKKNWDEVDKKHNPFLFKKAPGQGLAWGLTVYEDKAGEAAMKGFHANLSLAYHLMVTKNMVIAAGLLGGVVNRSIDASKLEWGSQYDGKKYNSSIIPAAPVSAESFMYPDVGAGLGWYFDKDERAVGSNDQIHISAGAALFHANEPPYSFYETAGEKLYQKMVLHAMGEIGLKGTPLSLLPSVAWYKQGPATELLTGGLLSYRLQETSKYTGRMKGASIALGGHYRNKDAVILSAMLQMAQYAVGISYDINTSGLKEASNGKGGIEISLRFLNAQQFLYQAKSKPQI